MKKMLANFNSKILSKEEMLKISGGVDYYWACNDNYDSIAYMTWQAAYNHCMGSLSCTSCQQFNIT